MPQKLTTNRNNRLAIVIVGVIAATLVLAAISIWKREPAEKITDKDEIKESASMKTQPVIEYPDTDTAESAMQLTETRKASLGIDGGVDLIVKVDETMKIGDAVVPMREILDRIKLKRGDIIESDIGQEALSLMESAPNNDAQGAYGIYVVQPNDNIWSIHFKFLQDYLKNRGISLSPTSDEAISNGSSSGVGKLLKFSEKMVHIYNVRDRELDGNLDLIHPLSKVVVFDMGRVFSLLDQIDYEHVNRIEFDGEIIWIPAKQ